MESVGLRALRQDASEIIRRVEAGNEIDITVSGRVAARLTPVKPSRWRHWDAIAGAFLGRPDVDFEQDRQLLDQSVTNPWDGR